MKTFEQFLKEQIAENIQEHGEEMAMATYSFTAHDVIKLVDMWQKLQQTPCSTQLPPSDYDLERLYEWIMDANRKSAKTAFTSGSLRKVADEIEFRLWRQLR